MLIFVLLLSAGCGDDAVCGPGEAPADGLSADLSDGTELTYGGFTSSPNNDCTPPEGGPTSLTLDGTQVGPAGFHITFCLPRPDQIGSDPIDVTDTNLIEIIDVNARIDDDCFLTLDRTQAATGTITFVGYCDDGLAEDGYAIELSAQVPGTIACSDSTTPVTIDLSGSAAVQALSI